jgi:signal transduction histidine kinase
MVPDSHEPVVLRSRFLADLSHEVRSPLHAIIGFSELLTDKAYGELNPQQQSAVEDIHCAAQHLLRLISDVLDISRLQLAKLDLHFEVLPLATVVEQAMHIAGGLARERRIALEAHVDSAVAVRADECRVLQILNNLLANAIRYAPPGTTVTVSVEPDEAAVWTLVRDRGPGISPTDQQRIFEAFVAIKNAEAEPGTGLGLSVCKSLVAAMGGEIEVASTLGEGSTFRFSLPRAEPPG